MSSMIELKRVVNESTIAGQNIVQPVCHIRGKQQVMWFKILMVYSLASIFKNNSNIISYHHSFRVSEDNPGIVF